MNDCRLEEGRPSTQECVQQDGAGVADMSEPEWVSIFECMRQYDGLQGASAETVDAPEADIALMDCDEVPAMAVREWEKERTALQAQVEEQSRLLENAEARLREDNEALAGKQLENQILLDEVTAVSRTRDELAAANAEMERQVVSAIAVGMENKRLQGLVARMKRHIEEMYRRRQMGAASDAGDGEAAAVRLSEELRQAHAGQQELRKKLAKVRWVAQEAVHKFQEVSRKLETAEAENLRLRNDLSAAPGAQ